MSLAVLGVPPSAVAHGVGLEKAPAALSSARLIDGLRAAGLDVIDAGDLEECLVPTRPHAAQTAEPRPGRGGCL